MCIRDRSECCAEGIRMIKHNVNNVYIPNDEMWLPYFIKDEPYR